MENPDPSKSLNHDDASIQSSSLSHPDCNLKMDCSTPISRPSKIDIATAAMKIFLIIAAGIAYFIYEIIKFNSRCTLLGIALLIPCIAIAVKVLLKHKLSSKKLLSKYSTLTEAVCSALFAATYALHIFTYGNVTDISNELMSSICLLFFIVLLTNSASGFVKVLAGRRTYGKGIRVGEPNRFLLVIAIALAIRIAVTLIGMLLYKLFNPLLSFPTAFSLWHDAWLKGNTDVNHYLNIAQNWYVAAGNDRLLIVFFPLFPLLIRVLDFVIHNGFISAQLLNTVLSCLATGMLYKVMRGWFSERRAFLAAIIFLLLPGSIFMYSPMSEPLFMLLSCCCFYFIQRKSYLLAGLFAGLAGFTRSVGILLFVPIAVEGAREIIGLIRQKENVSRRLTLLFCGLLLATLGTLAYLGINKAITGDAFMFSKYQKLNWNQGVGFFFDTPRYMTSHLLIYIHNGEWDTALSLAVPTLITIFLSLIIYTRKAKQLPASMNAYFIAYFIIAIGCTWLLSAVRYMSVCIPLIAALALLPKSRKGSAALITVTAITHFIYVVFYMLRLALY